ncbi:conserved hypothetical protein [Candida dubliniensis CD36]|uniref:Large ribosomal subunit protein mL50 n=1 Tax=Candida dubliniensis (strain CD36 / ATCC MYA-646 / CBS 7987 / NCPF 3949 / NRRL Y-17841) TaxID=573826 RepID=B9W9M2_CANDC|nr:conserved hypothetical protein [Candida dubliniensis CD36]CAX45506.1 conserved hypothetical protein [Candida dubliniensis CD36]
MLRSQIIQTRSFTSITRNLSWFGDIFGKNKSSIESKQKRQDIITKQDELIESNSIKIHHLTFKNSDKYQSFNIESDMPNFHKLKNWKFQKSLTPENYETFYSDKSILQNIINQELKNFIKQDQEINRDNYKDIKLDDLQFRFEIVKSLQSKLGIDINDYIISKSHDLQSLYEEIEKIVNKRWKNERNPNAIVLRPEDFDADNIYLNQERTDYEKNLQLQKLVQKVKISQSQQ